jgi:hypothetical protein
MALVTKINVVTSNSKLMIAMSLLKILFAMKYVTTNIDKKSKKTIRRIAIIVSIFSPNNPIMGLSA